MGAEPLPTSVPALRTEAEYLAAVARFWELVDRPTDLDLLLALREALREYERAHPN